MAFWGSLHFQNLINYVNSGLESLHDMVMVWLTVILVVVILFGAKTLFNKTTTVLSLDSTLLEVVWTLVPMVILVVIAVPSIHLLCLQDDLRVLPKDTLKVLSNQWNWQSERVEQVEHLLDANELEPLVSYDSPMVLSLNMISRLLLTSSDVLHSMGVPSMGVKLDSSPGRLNVVVLESFSPGLLMGSCYELCGSGHSAMPFCFLVA